MMAESIQFRKITSSARLISSIHGTGPLSFAARARAGCGLGASTRFGPYVRSRSAACAAVSPDVELALAKDGEPVRLTAARVVLATRILAGMGRRATAAADTYASTANQASAHENEPLHACTESSHEALAGAHVWFCPRALSDDIGFLAGTLWPTK